MSLCEIKTSDPNNPVLVNPKAVTAVVASSTGHGAIIQIGSSTIGGQRFIETALTTSQVAEALEAHCGCTQLERSLILALQRIASHDPEARDGCWLFGEPTSEAFAVKVLRIVGLPDAEPQGDTNER